jgi:hypothetical protein
MLEDLKSFSLQATSSIKQRAEGKENWNNGIMEE